jgi:hypothetical protein
MPRIGRWKPVQRRNPSSRLRGEPFLARWRAWAPWLLLAAILLVAFAVGLPVVVPR